MPSGIFRVTTARQRELINITEDVQKILKSLESPSGILYLFNPHTTAGLTINEGADPAVRTDIIQGLNDIVSENLPYRHQEGNSPAHIMATLTGCSLCVMVNDKCLQLGVWQKIFFCEFDGPRNRSIHWKYLADQ